MSAILLISALLICWKKLRSHRRRRRKNTHYWCSCILCAYGRFRVCILRMCSCKPQRFTQWRCDEIIHNHFTHYDFWCWSQHGQTLVLAIFPFLYSACGERNVWHINTHLSQVITWSLYYTCTQTWSISISTLWRWTCRLFWPIHYQHQWSWWTTLLCFTYNMPSHSLPFSHTWLVGYTHYIYVLVHVAATVCWMACVTTLLQVH